MADLKSRQRPETPRKDKKLQILTKEQTPGQEELFSQRSANHNLA